MSADKPAESIAAPPRMAILHGAAFLWAPEESSTVCYEMTFCCQAALLRPADLLAPISTHAIAPPATR